MKKLILTVAIALGTFTTISAQTAKAETAKPATSTTATSTTTTKTTSPAQDFREIKQDALPESLKATIKTAYPGAIINNVYVNDAKEYKYNLTVGDQTGVVYSDASGNWIKKD